MLCTGTTGASPPDHDVMVRAHLNSVLGSKFTGYSDGILHAISHRFRSVMCAAGEAQQ